MKKKLLLPIIGLFSLVASAEVAHVYEIRPWDNTEIHVSTNGQSSVEHPINSEFYFVIRLLNPGWSANDGSATNAWNFVLTDAYALKSWAEEWNSFPPQIGLVIGGVTRYAEVIDCFPDAGINTSGQSKYFTDILCRYTVKPGDFALPVRFAQDRFGTPITINNAGGEIYLDTRNGRWRLAWGSDTAILKMVDTVDLMYKVPPENVAPYTTRNKDITFSLCNFNLKTVDFTGRDDTDKWYSTTAWRGVHKGGTSIEGGLASISVTSAPTNSATLYVWSGNPDIIQVADGTDATIDGNSWSGSAPVSLDTKVKAIELSNGVQTYNFKLEAIGSVGKTATLYLSQYKGFNWNKTISPGELEADYLEIPVTVLEPEKKNVKVTAEGSATVDVPANRDSVTVAQSTLELKISGGYTGSELTVTITPELADTAATSPWNAYVHINDNDSASAWLNATPLTIRLAKDTSDDDYDADFATGKDISRTIYVYTLGADKFTSSAGHEVFFNVGIDSTAAAYFTGYAPATSRGVLFLRPAKPTLSTAVASVKTIANVDCGFELVVDDNYKNVSDTTGYEIYYQQSDEDPWEKLDGNFQPDGSGVLHLTTDSTKLPSLKYVPGTFTTKFKVRTPVGDLESDVVSVAVEVSEPQTVKGWIQVKDGDPVDTGTYDEGETIKVRAVISRPFTSPSELYAFLAPADATTLACVSTNLCNILTNSQNSAGMKITGKSWDPVELASDWGDLYINDGMDATLKFDIVICSTSEYDPGNIVKTYQSKTFSLTANNKKPSITAVWVDSTYTVQNYGETLAASIPKDVPKTFTFDVNDVDADLMATDTGKEFQLKYSILEANGASIAPVALVGNPNATNFTYTFKASGVATVNLWLKDKDTDKFSTNPDFSFKVNVLSAPSISISDGFNSKIAEGVVGSDSARLTLTLSENSSADPLDIEITVDASNPSSGKDNGLLVLGGLNLTNKVDGLGAPITNVYCVTLSPGQTEYNFYIKESDGTAESALGGFVLTPKVTTTTMVPSVPTKTWADYYLASAKGVTVVNVPPTIFCSLGAENTSTNAIPGSIGNNDPITWSVADVAERDHKSGLTAQWWTSDYGNETATKVTDETEYTFTPKFKSSGTKMVRLTVTDKDKGTGNGTTSMTWYYEVAPSKTLTTVALGPSRGTGNSLVSQRYAASAGIGEGHVWADADFAGADSFVLSWNCGLDIYANVWAYGYKMNAVDDGTLNSTPSKRDIALDKNGNNATGAALTPGTEYVYSPDDGRDSFFYALLLTAKEEGSSVVASSVSGGTVSPEIEGRVAVKNTIALPDTTAGDSGKYTDTIVEAIFAKEFDPADNMGDIDQDGLPDYFAVSKIWASGGTLVSIDGVGGELGKGASMNEDGDYLPTDMQMSGTDFFSGSGWETSGQAFTALLETRGFHKGLNFGMFPITDGEGWVSDLDMSDAEKNALLEYAKADTKHTSEATALTNYVASTTVSAWLVLPEGYTPTQYDTYTNEQAMAKAYIALTWKGYKKAEPTTWGFTVENRTDPTQWDTDGDNIPDGYEYYYWYASTIGFDAAGTRIEGWKFNLEDIEDPIKITSEEIAAVFNPNGTANFNWVRQDTDGDGLTDYEEYVLGTSPFNWDTDGDKVSDLYEVLYGIDPLAANSAANNGSYNGDGDFMAQADLGTFRIYTYGGKTYAYSPILPPIDVLGIPGPGTNTFTGIGFEVAAFKDAYIPVKRTFTKNDAEATLTYIHDLSDPSADPVLVNSSAHVMLYHYQVYNYYGFSPRTGWGGNYSNQTLSPTGRWLNNGSPMMAGQALHTEKYTSLDEFLLLKYRYITGLETYSKDKKTIDDAEDKIQKFCDIIISRTTNGGIALEEKSVGERTFSAKVHGADTDSDGVPDGWELYVGVDPNIPYTDTQREGLYNEIRISDGADGLALAAEFAGTDSTLAYQSCETIYANHPSNESGCMYQWYNKFFPTDPRSDDTDGDGITDGAEKSSWSEAWTYNRWGNGKTAKIDGKGIQAHHKSIYGNPSDNGSLSIRGGGFNPGTIDTDGDGLPDLWEHQYAGIVFTGDGPAEGSLTTEGTIDPSFYDDMREAASAYNSSSISNESFYVCMGQDGTFADAFTDVGRGLTSADWDADGLENGQEYMIQAMRHLRYDDPVTPLMGRDSPAFNPATGLIEPGAWNGEGGASGDSGFVGVPLGEELDEGELETLEKLGFGNFAAYVRRDPEYLRTLGYFAVPPKDWDPAGPEGLGYRYMLPPQPERLGTEVRINYNQYTNDVGRTLWAPQKTYNFQEKYDCWSTNNLSDVVITNATGTIQQLGNLKADYTPADKNQIVSNDVNGTTYYYAIDYDDTGTTTNYYANIVYKLHEVVVVTNSVTTLLTNSVYVSTDPRLWDTDEDGMDDYYEMFHGLNPILGSIGTIERYEETNENDQVTRRVSQTGAKDIIASAYGSSVSVIRNAWLGWDFENEPVYDALKYPWMMGTSQADADGDGLRNEEEALMANLTSPTATHTDPTPLWMTDTTVSPTNYNYYVTTPVTNYLTDAAGNYIEQMIGGVVYPMISNIVDEVVLVGTVKLYKSPSYTAQYYDAPWYGAPGFNPGYAFDFEQNEGYDTDSDKRSDSVERRNLTEPSSDPLDFTDPSRRQSIHFGGDSNQGVAISYDPITRPTYPSNSDFLKQFTVEAWVFPENLSVAHEQYIVSRSANYGGWNLSNSNAVIRTAFAIGIDTNGYAFAEIEDTTKASERVSSKNTLAFKTWTHIAATYDGSKFTLYINGVKDEENMASIKPANGVTDLEQDPQTSHNAYFPVVNYVTVPSATLIGAKANGAGAFGYAAASTISQWTDLADNFYEGSVSEVRVWDGARTAEEIAAAYKKAFTSAEIDEMRREIYKLYESSTARRNDNSVYPVLPAELVQHYNFSTIGGATATNYAQIVSAGFENNVLDEVCENGMPVIRDLLNVGWWSELLSNPVLGSSVYNSKHVVPWIGNTVGHMPRLSGVVADSVFWSERFAGWTPASFQALGSTTLEKFVFPNTMDPYNLVFRRSSGTRSQKDQNLIYKTQILRAQHPGNEDYDEFWASHLYDLRREFPGTSDLLPLGSAYAERKETYWDGSGPEDAWAVTRNGEPVDGDADDDGLPDWAIAKGYDTRAKYLAALSDGLLPSGMNAAYSAYGDNGDYNGNNIPDWWERYFGIYGCDAYGDLDNDGLSNYQEYFISFGDWTITETQTVSLINHVCRNKGMRLLDPTNAHSPDTNGVSSVVVDYFLKPEGITDNRVAANSYYGEMVGDHDFMETWWENSNDRSYTDPYVYDAHMDSDGDGWDNWSEARAMNSIVGDTSDTTYGGAPVPNISVKIYGVGGSNGVTLSAYTGSTLGEADAVFSITDEAVNGIVETVVPGTGLKQGLNTFIATTADGKIGVARNVDVGFDSAVVELALAESDLYFTAPAQPDADGLCTVEIVRTSINGSDCDSRRVYTKKIDLSEARTFTPAEIIAPAYPGLDWRNLSTDAKEMGVSIQSVGYTINANHQPIGTFTVRYNTARTVASPVAPVDSAPVYSAKPTFRFASEDETSTAYRLQVAQVAAAATNLVWDSGVAALPCKQPYTLDNPSVWAVTPELYVDTFVSTNDSPVLYDGSNYLWRVAMLNPKYPAADENVDSEWSAWAAFQMDVGNNNRNPDMLTGYGSVAVAVRYYGAGDVTDLSGSSNVVVEAYSTPDFTAAPIARMFVSVTNNLDNAFDVATTNCTLSGIAPGDVYLLAFIDSNGNGSRDKWESWGYANGVGADTKYIYTPKAVSITEGALETVTVYIEDCDRNQNEVPDILEGVKVEETDVVTTADTDGDGLTDVDELMLYGTDPENADTDGDGMPDGWEVENGLDPFNDDRDVCGLGDVMAYNEAELLVMTSTNTLGEASLYIVNTFREEGADQSTNTLYKSFVADGVLYVGAPLTAAETVDATNGYVSAQKRIVRVIHSAVYDFYGFDPTTAKPGTATTDAEGNETVAQGANTVPFTAYLKYLTQTRYLAQFNGGAATNDFALSQSKLDSNGNYLPDGWELYIRYAAGETFATAVARTAYGDNGAEAAFDPYDDYYFYNKAAAEGTLPELVAPYDNAFALANGLAGATAEDQEAFWSYAPADDVMAFWRGDLQTATKGADVFAVSPANGELYSTTNFNGQLIVTVATGTLYTNALTSATVVDSGVAANVAVMHSAVYDFFGYDPTTAKPGTATTDAEGNETVSAGANTAAFTRLWKQATQQAYLPAVGGASDFALASDVTDSNGNSVADGYELYIKYATAKATPAVTYSAELAARSLEEGFDPYDDYYFYNKAVDAGFFEGDLELVPAYDNAFAIANGLADATAEEMAEFWNKTLPGDYMAYATVTAQLLVSNDTCYVALPVKDASGVVVATNYYNTIKLPNNAIVATTTNAMPAKIDYATVSDNIVLIHSAVYDYFGFDPTTANPNAEERKNTRAFSALWKKVTEEYLKDFSITWALNENAIDSNANGLPDGWELYVGLAANTVDTVTLGQFPMVTPNLDTAIVNFGEGFNPSDPWDMYAIYNSLPSTNGVVKFTNLEAHSFNIADGDLVRDDDFDGLSNYQEFAAGKTYTITLDPKLAKTDGITNDYFRAAGASYMGALLNGSEFIEPEARAAMGLSGMQMAGTRAAASGWDYWSIARYSYEAYRVSETNDFEIVEPRPDVALTLRYPGDGSKAVTVKAYQVNPAYPEIGEDLVATWSDTVEFSGGTAKFSVGGADSEDTTALKQGDVRFEVSIDGTDVSGVADAVVGWAGVTATVQLGEPNNALAAISLASSSTNSTETVQLIGIVRTKINGERVTPRGVMLRKYWNNVNRSASSLSAYQVYGTAFTGLDRYLASDYTGDDLMSIESVTYEVVRLSASDVNDLVGDPSGISVSNLNWYVEGTNDVFQTRNDEFTVDYSLERDQPLNLRVFADSTVGNSIAAFDVPTDGFASTRFWVEVSNSTATVVHGGTGGFLLDQTVDGRVIIDLDEITGAPLANDTYTVRVALGNDKYGAPTVAADWSEPATFHVNNAANFSGKIDVTVTHPMPVTLPPGSTLVVGAFETPDLAVPFKTNSVATFGTPVSITGLREDFEYYVAAWIINNPADGREGCERMPYDTWGYATELGVDATGFDALAVKATAAGAPAEVVLQDTDWNDNGVIDRTETFQAKNGVTDPEPPDTSDLDLDGIPDGTDPDPVFYNGDDYLDGDVMAYAEVDLQTIFAGANLASAQWYVVGADDVTFLGGENATNAEFRLMTTYVYGRPKSGKLALGAPATFAAGATNTVFEVKTQKVVLVHAQVYDWFGFDSATANPAVTKGKWVNTKHFTFKDKSYVTNYLHAVGAVSTNDWSGWTLSIARTDCDFDGVPDGWELYTMFGTAGVGTTLTHTPWSSGDREIDVDGDGLSFVNEWNGGIAPTDPWNVDTDGDGVNDKAAREYFFVKDAADVDGRTGYRGDYDNDQLPNFIEYLIGGLTNLPDVVASKMATFDGQLVPDYFLRHGSLYLGEMFTDHDMIEDWWEDDHKADGYSRYAFEANGDNDADGWSNWAEARRDIAGITDQPSCKVTLYYGGKKQPASSETVTIVAWSENRDSLGSPDATWVIEDVSGLEIGRAEIELGAPESGRLHEGRNMFAAYVGSGSFTPGSPYGVATGVDVGYAAIEPFAIELTDVDSSMVRIDLAGAIERQVVAYEAIAEKDSDWMAKIGSGDATARGEYDEILKSCYDDIVSAYTDRSQTLASSVALHMPDYFGTNLNFAASNTVYVWLTQMQINGIDGDDDQERAFYMQLPSNAAPARLYYDFSQRSLLTEADMLAGLKTLDLGWDVLVPAYLAGGAKNHYYLTNAVFGVVFKIGPTLFDDESGNNVLAVEIENRYEKGVRQTAVGNRAVENTHGRPTFSWKHDNSIGKAYPAFRLQVWKTDGTTLVYDSGALRAPARDKDGVYRWTAPLWSGCITAQGQEFKADEDYYWDVSMLDAKFTTPLNLDTTTVGETCGKFKMSDDAMLSDYGAIAVAVKYMGPASTAVSPVGASVAKMIRVEAFSTPDFCGTPVAEAYVRTNDTIAATNVVAMNARLTGLQKGKQYYVRAYIDSDGDCERDVWESWGYGNYVGDDSRRDVYTPRAYGVAVEPNDEFTTPTAVVYVEDLDTNANKLPDAWEFDMYGALGTTSVATNEPFIVTIDSTATSASATNVFYVIEKDVVDLPYYSALTEMKNGGKLSAASLALAMSGIDLTALSVSPKVTILDFSPTAGLSLEIDAGAKVDAATLAATRVSVSVQIDVTVEYVTSLAETWKPITGSPFSVVVNVAAGKVVLPSTATELSAVNTAISGVTTTSPTAFFRVKAVKAVHK